MSKLKVFSIFIFVICLASCQTAPKDEEIIKLLSNNGFVVKKYIVVSKGGSYKVNDSRVFPVTVIKRYIWPGLTYGYQLECPEQQCCKDEFIYEKYDYLLRRDNFKNWEIFDSKQIEKNVQSIIWRPASISQEEYYKDFFEKLENQDTTEIKF